MIHVNKQQKQKLRNQNILTVSIISLIWLALFPRFIPLVTDPDRGIFISVAERLAAGDRLYIDVWDNKDPLFYWIIAAGRLISPYMDIATEIIYLALESLAVMLIARAIKIDIYLSALIGFGLTPIIVTGIWYFAGSTHIPAEVFLFWSLATLLWRKYFLCGFFLGLLFFTKLLMFPLGFMFVFIYFWFNRNIKAVISIISGLVASTSIIIFLLVFREEFNPYLDMLQKNFIYSNSELLLKSSNNIIIAHLQRVIDIHALVLIGLTLLLLAIFYRQIREFEYTSDNKNLKILYFSAAGSLVVSLGILSVTGLWDNHTQILYIPALLTLILLTWHLANNESNQNLNVNLIFLITLALIFSGIDLTAYKEGYQNKTFAIAGLARPSYEAKILKSYPKPGSYAIVGTNDELGHAKGLRSWKLACPRFHQYDFDSAENLYALTNCLPSADVIFITTNLDRKTENQVFNIFHNSVINLVNAENEKLYACFKYERGGYCVKRSSIVSQTSI